MSTATAIQTVETRFTAAVEQVREREVIFTPNVMTCCRSCSTDTDRGVPEGQRDSTPFAWTFGGQGGRVEFDDGLPVRVEDANEIDNECSCYDMVIVEEEYDDDGEIVTQQEVDLVECDFCRRGPRAPRRAPARSIYVYHGGPGVVAASAVAEAFTAQGFAVEWDGTTDTSVQINF